MNLENIFYHAELWQIGIAVFMGFGFIYFGLAGLTLYLTRQLLPRWGIGRIIDKRPLKPGQVAKEIKLSLISIFVFALYGVFTMWCEQNSYLEIEWQLSFNKILLDIIVLIVWNEIHFYLSHALLHKPWFYRHIHIVHHHSVTPTPFSTYSFHWGEALILSSVMILIMPFWTLNIGAIILFPLISLIMNNIGHMNYAVFPQLALNQMFSSCRRHTLHHSRIKGNYGFLVPYFDKLFNTRAKNIDYSQTLEEE